MHKTTVFRAPVTAGLILFLFSSAGISNNPEDMFPEFKGWELNVGERVYTPDNLWDIINGAADLYLSYDFQRLYTAEYYDDRDRQIKVYIFEHSNPINTFGIYSQERSDDYELNETGAQGFKSGGAYYFIAGPYYVQISVHHGELRDTLDQLANLINKKLDQRDRLPRELQLFPEKGKIPVSEKYIASNFLGYSFLHSAFVASYQQGEKTFKIFIINPEDKQETENILNNYLDFVEFPRENRGQKRYRIEDPYNGSVLLYITGKYLCGIMGTDSATMEAFFTLLKDRLE